MKFLYQQLLAFLALIVVTVGTLSILFFHLSKQMVYENAWNQMEGYAFTLKNEALDITKKSGQAVIRLNVTELQTAEKLLYSQHTRFTIYTANNEIMYPKKTKQISNAAISKEDWEDLQRGKIIRNRNEVRPNTSSIDVDKTANKNIKIIDIYTPCFDSNGNLVAVIMVGEDISTLSDAVNRISQNLVVIFAIALIIGVFLSTIIAHYLTKRITKLRQATSLVADGNFDVEISTNERDEIDKLSSDFNSMVTSLRESSEEIKRQERRREEFFADAAHEMRTPLTTINGLLEGLAYDVIPEESKEKSIELMRSETNRLIRLVNKNLDYERIRAGNIALNKSEFGVQGVVSNIVSQLESKAEEVGDKFEINIPKNLKVYADYDRFVQIIFNVTQNAIQFTNDGLIKIAAEKGFNELIIHISDTGIGMEEKDLKNIWERYYKADESRTNTKYGESGLGLSIVHKLIELHGGKVEVVSKKNVGTTFTLIFPDKDEE